jgi:hypothetical protein
MNVDTELEAWRRQWQSETTVPRGLRRMVERQSRWMKIHLASQVFVTITIGGATAAWAVRAPQPHIVLLAIWTWVLIAAAWMFSLRANRGNWSPSAQDTAVFIDLSVRRCRARLAAIPFASGFFLIQIGFVLGWVYKYSPAHSIPLLRWLFFSSLPIDTVWLCTVAFFGFLIWLRRRKLAELAYFLSLREDKPSYSIEIR